MSKIIRNTITNEVTAAIATESLHLRKSIEFSLCGDDIFRMEDGIAAYGKPIAELAAYDDMGEQRYPLLAAVFTGNLDDADLLVKRINNAPCRDYFMARRPYGYCEGLKGGREDA